MAQIGITDIIFARILWGGRELCNVRLSHVASATELLVKIKTQLTEMGQHIAGLVKLCIRNLSQGWSTEMPVFL